jgi:dolichol-phosphate mannosyltransferase
MKKTLIFIPTYNEKENAVKLAEKILALKLPDTDILFIDDNSPDGTGKLLKKLAKAYKNMSVRERSGKLGIGSAHKEAISYAYSKGYKKLLTMDSDFTHRPKDIPLLLAASSDCDIVIGSRYKMRGSMDDWTPMRILMNKLGHLMTKILFDIDYDSSNALRVYNLSSIDKKAFGKVKDGGYFFFVESIVILKANGYKIKEIGVKLPKRIVGKSKMKLKDIISNVKLLVLLYFRTLNKASLLVNK